MDPNYQYYNQVCYPQPSSTVYVPGVPSGPQYHLPNTVFQYQPVAVPGPLPVLVSQDIYPVMDGCVPVNYSPLPGEITQDSVAQYSGVEMQYSQSATVDNSAAQNQDRRMDHLSHNIQGHRGGGRGRANWRGRGQSRRHYDNRQNLRGSWDNTGGYSPGYSDNNYQGSAASSPRNQRQNDDYKPSRSFQSKGSNSRYQNSGPQYDSGQRAQGRSQQERYRPGEENGEYDDGLTYSPSEFVERTFRNSDRNGQQGQSSKKNDRGLDNNGQQGQSSKKNDRGLDNNGQQGQSSKKNDRGLNNNGQQGQSSKKNDRGLDKNGQQGQSSKKNDRGLDNNGQQGQSSRNDDRWQDNNRQQGHSSRNDDRGRDKNVQHWQSSRNDDRGRDNKRQQGQSYRNDDRGQDNRGYSNYHSHKYDRYNKNKSSTTNLSNSREPFKSDNLTSQQSTSRAKNMTSSSDGFANLTDEEKERLSTAEIDDGSNTGEARPPTDPGHADLVDKITGLIGSKNLGKLGRLDKLHSDFRRDDGKLAQGNDRDARKSSDKNKEGPNPRTNSKQSVQRKREAPNLGNPVETQRDSLIEQLHHGDYECMVCCNNVRCEAAIWSCNNCYHIFHLFCIKKWARSPAAVIEVGGGWRCPGCQNVSEKVPNRYRCFCGKQLDPGWDRYETPHSCGEVCGKQRNKSCPHPCNILCHPGPCPPCEATVNKRCECGKTEQFMKCSQSSALRCDKVCEKELSCTKHFCSAICHKGPCNVCEQTIKQACYCCHTSRTVTCGTEESLYTSFTCGHSCNRSLDCGEHVCKDICHDGLCKPCPLQPARVTRCPCGQTELSSLTDTFRETCLDPIPICDNECCKPLSCGPIDNPHVCELRCHEGECGTCQGMTSRMCRCGRLKKDLACMEASQFTADNPLMCERRCNKKKHCGKHKCNQPCCVDDEHFCDLVCGRKLNCGLHKCDQPCHRGNCQPCLQASFDELTCFCGTEVIYPPVACGTCPPECRKFCTRIHPCTHPVCHSCNPDGECPPCTVLTEKRCMGNHESRKNIPCFREEISCGLACTRSLPCGQHRCKKTCHKGPCLEEGENCTQHCVIKRLECGHPCGAPCHSGTACPKTACKTLIKVKCRCGNRAATVKCLSGGLSGPDITDYQRVTTANLASSLSGLQTGQTVDITELAALQAGQRQLECDKECAVLERNKRVALALEIRNPDLSAKLGNPGYSHFLKDFAKQNPQHVSSVEKSLSDLVQSAKQSKQPFRRHPFPPMNMNQRHLIHELAEFYGCETESYDSEPKKNVVATAHKERCWLPSVTLTSLVQRELLPKAPMPIPHSHNESDLRDAMRGMKLSTDVYVEPKRQEKKSSAPVVDYFDMTD